jgi:hypothetical protein
MTEPPQSRDGHALETAGISRIVLRPIGSPLPLGVLALVPAGVLMGGRRAPAALSEAAGKDRAAARATGDGATLWAPPCLQVM